MRIPNLLNQPNLTCKGYTQSTPAKSEDAKDTNSYASAVAIASLASVFAVFMLSRGFQKNAQKLFKKAKVYLEEKVDHSVYDDTKEKTKFYEFALKKINSFIQKSESINNIVTYKDVLFMKLMYETKPTKKIHDAITNYFEKISRKTVLDSYKNTKNNFEKMNHIYEKLDKEILKDSPDKIISHKGKLYTKRELVEKAGEHRKNVLKIINDFSSEEALNKRYRYINEKTSALYSSFWDSSIKGFFSQGKFKQKGIWQTFIAAEHIKGDKSKLYKEVADVRNSITYTKQDRTDLINDYTSKLNEILPSEDKEGLNIVKRLEWLAEHSEGLQYNNNGFLQELANLENHTLPKSLRGNTAKIKKEELERHIKTLKELIENKGRGELQEMMALYYKASPYEHTRSGATAATKRAIKSFDKSVDLENNAFFDKVRDLRLGSAPTDVLTVIFSFLALSIGFGYAKDKDEKISVMYKSGIPIVGGIITALYTAAKLVSGGKALSLGILSGIVLNQLGNITDKYRKTY